jgi:hypothetical protein
VSCAHLSETLRDTFGTDGAAALLSRALARVDRSHGALAAVWRSDGREIHLDGVAEAVQEHGLPEVKAALGVLRAAILEVLGRLIGEEMAIRILDLPAAPRGPTEDV